MRHRLLLAVLAPALFSLGACGGSTTSPAGAAAAPPVPIAKSSLARDPEAGIAQASLSAAVAANNAFAFDLFGRLGQSAPSHNLLTSPLSASLALTMLYAGAAGETSTQMATALHFEQQPGSTPSTIFDGQNALSQLLSWRAPDALGNAVQTASENGDPAPNADDYQLEIVNSMWGDKTETWAPAFLDTLTRSYGAGVYQEDFLHQADAARQTINAWVSTSTNDKINDLLPTGSLNSSTRIVLVNAVHLKLPWQTAFDPAQTKSAPFTRRDGTIVTTPFMNTTAWLPYQSEGSTAADGTTTTTQLIHLPLSGSSLEVVIALPSVDLAAYEATLTTTGYFGPAYNQQYLALSLPKVAFTTATFSLASTLQAMGMTDAFTPQADFSGLKTAGDPIQIADVLQKSMIAMQETGVEAAAATAVIGTTDSASGDLPTPVVVDHPFVIAVEDVTTGAILFVGHVEDPTDVGTP